MSKLRGIHVWEVSERGTQQRVLMQENIAVWEHKVPNDGY